MTRPRIMLGLVAVAALAVSGCYTMEIDATPMQPPVAMTSPGQVETVGQLDGRTTASWLLWGLVPMSEPNVAGVLDREIRRLNGTGAAGVEITTQVTFMDGLISALTLGLYSQRSTMVSGRVVR